jgi:putative Ig domain-containing protein
MRLASVARALPALALSAAVLLQAGCSGGGAAATAQTAASNVNSNPPPAALVITTNWLLPRALVGQPYSTMLQASGGTPPYTWGVVGSSSFPAGISLSASGLLSGTPTTWGSQLCYLQVTDSSSPPQTAKQSFSFYVVQPLAFTTSVPPPASARNFYSYFFFITGGIGPFTWTISSGSLPPGLALAQGTISGVPTVRGTYNFTVQVGDPGPPQQTASLPTSITVFDYPQITTSSLPVGLINYPYSTQLQAIGGTPPYSWSTPRLPGGLQLDSSGKLSGTPIVQWFQPASFTVTDSSLPPLQSTANLLLDINTPLTFTQSQPALPDAVQGRPYTYPLPFQGGLPPYAITIPSGALPVGVSVPTNSAAVGTFSGSPSATGTSSFTLQVQDSESPRAAIQQSFSIRVNPPLVITTTQAPPGVAGLPYSFQFQATGGVQPYTWSTTGLSDGLTMDLSTGLLSGTPTTANSLYLNVVVVDSSNPHQSAIVSFPLPIYNRLKIISLVIPPLAPNSPVNMQLNGFGGTGNYAWSVSSGTLPAGLILNSAGQITGQASQTGSFPVTLQLSDAGPPAQTATLPTTLTVSASLGRNDSPATATPLSNGTYQASISPFSDPPTGTPNPDTDYYVLTANPGATVTIEIRAQRLNPPSPLDSVLEIVDASNNRLSLCSAPAGLCLNDDLPDGTSTDSILTMQVPPGNSGPLTFYAHVLDWRGDARPDFIYTITVTGAN